MDALDGAIRAVAVLASGMVLLGFTLFAVDQMRHASSHQVSELSPPGMPPAPAPPSRPSATREAIDDAYGALISPFSAVTSSRNVWVDNGLPAVLALLIYGVGLGFLARYARGRT